LSASGSDWTTIHVKNVETREDLKEELKYCKFTSVAWKLDSSGFYYTRYPAPDSKDLGTETDSNENCKIYFHKIGTSQEEDVLIFEEPDHPKRRFGVLTTKDGKYLIISAYSTTGDKNLLYYLKIDETYETENGIAKVNRIIDYYEYSYDYVANDLSVFYFLTNEEADNKKLIQIDFENPEKKNWKEIIPQSEDPLEDVSAVNGKFFILQYTHNVVDVLKIHDFSGKYIKDLEIPGLGQILSVSGRREDKELFYKFSSFTCLGTIYRYDCKIIDELTRKLNKTKLQLSTILIFPMQRLNWMNSKLTKFGTNPKMEPAFQCLFSTKRELS
jgi:prolyl oligopeptidase